MTLMSLNKKLTIGIIIPIFNNEDTLNRCLNSVKMVKKNKWLNFFCVCIDDASSDKSGKIIEKYKNLKVVDLHIINKKNKGISASRNIGIKKCKNTKWIFFLDADDEVVDNFINLRKFLNKKVSQIICSHKSCELKNEVIINHLPNEAEFKTKKLVDYMQEYFKQPNKKSLFTSCWGRLYNSDIIFKESTTLFNEKMNTAEDVHFTHQILLKNPDFIYSKQIIYKNYISIIYRKSLSSTFAITHNVNHLFGFLWAVRSAKKIIKKYSNIDSLILNNMIHHCISAYLMIYYVRSTMRVNSLKDFFFLSNYFSNLISKGYFKICLKNYSVSLANGNKVLFFLIKKNKKLLSYIYALYCGYKRYRFIRMGLNL